MVYSNNVHEPLPPRERIIFEPLTGELKLFPVGSLGFEFYFKFLVSEVCHSILADGDAAYDKSGNQYICDMAYLIILFSYNLKFGNGFSDNLSEFEFFENKEWEKIRKFNSDELLAAIKKVRTVAGKVIKGLKLKGLSPMCEKLEIEKR